MLETNISWTAKTDYIKQHYYGWRPVQKTQSVRCVTVGYITTQESGSNDWAEHLIPVGPVTGWNSESSIYISTTELIVWQIKKPGG